MVKQRRKESDVAEEPAKRGQGRPRASEKIDGAEQLLAAARQLLLTTHPDQISQAMVAKQAGVDPRLVRYYFGNMENLLFDLAKSMMKEVEVRMAAASNVNGDVFDKIKSRIKALLQWYTEVPMFWPLIIDRVYGSDDDEATSLRRSFNRSSYSRIEAIILKGIDEDLIRKEIDPRFLYLFLIGACEIFITGKPISDILFSQLEQETLEESYADFLSGIVVRGLRSAPSTG